MTELPRDLDFERALMFFHAYMYGPLQGKLRLYRARNVAPRAVASPTDWEVFASMLLRQPGTLSHAGVDLLGYEVKSAQEGSSFEYQYHRDSWEEKFQRDMEAGHLLFSHRDYLRSVRLYYADGKEIKTAFFEPWRNGCPYATDPAAQRYRRSIPFGWVTSHGQLVMELRDGEVIHPAHAQDAH